MSAYECLAEALLHAARDIGRVETAFDAELLLSTLLGSVYAAGPADRARAEEEFLAVLRSHLAEAGTAHAALVSTVLAALTGQPGHTGADHPAWVGALGRVRVTGGYAYGDRYGDQTSYLATFAYDSPLGGPEHAVVVLVDHNFGLAKDLMVTAPAAPVLEHLRSSVGADEQAMTWFAEVEPGTVGTVAGAYLRGTDLAAELPEGSSLPANRAVVLARLRTLPAPAPGPAPPRGHERPAGPAAPGGPDTGQQPGPGRRPGTRPRAGRKRQPAPAGPTTPGSPAAAPAGTTPGGTAPGTAAQPVSLVDEFRAAPDARLAGLADLTGPRHESYTYCLGLIVDFGAERGGDPLRWSPQAVELFLLDWVHQRAVLDEDDARLLPEVLGTWVSWAGRRLDLPIPAIDETVAAVRRLRAEFARRHASGERRSPAVRALAELLAEGVDPSDPAALDAWIQRRLGPAGG